MHHDGRRAQIVCLVASFLLSCPFCSCGKVLPMKLLSALIIVTSIAASAIADDWPQWGGPQRDLVWREAGIVETLPNVDSTTGMLPREWTAKIGAGYAGPAVADGRVFVTDRIAEDNLERVLCFDAATGQEIWKHPYESEYT